MKRTDTMNWIGAFEAARKIVLPMCVLLPIWLAIPSGVAGQTAADRESVNRVVEALLAAAGLDGDEIPHTPGAWSLVIARFATGDSREVPIPTTAGEEYMAKGVAESVGTDSDICIYGPAGDQIDRDTADDCVPVVVFHAKTEGTYRAVMTAASVEGGGTSFAGMIVLRELDEGDQGGGIGK